MEVLQATIGHKTVTHVHMCLCMCELVSECVYVAIKCNKVLAIIGRVQKQQPHTLTSRMIA